jgi:flagellar hook protein FlgE
LTGIEVGSTGIVSARFTNGQSKELGKVAMASFSNPNGLQQQGDTSWAETYASGSPRVGEAGSSDFGLLQSGALESSNVDLTSQLVEMITAQRNFQANTQMISTADAVTQAIINIR